MTWATGPCKIAKTSDHFFEEVADTDNRETENKRIASFRALVSPQILLEDIPITDRGKATVSRFRRQIADIIHGLDNRWLVIVGPCSIHDISSALDYASRIRALADELSDELLIVMRVYFEKPRTTIGWKGLINDPELDGSSNINKGLRVARNLLNNIANLGVPAGCEFLDTVTHQYIGDLVSWAAIGARTAECQLHRELASSLPMPVAFKNSTSGDVDVAIDALSAAAHPHSFISVSKQGTPVVVNSKGNVDTHVVLRGSKYHTNFEKSAVSEVIHKQIREGLVRRLMIDCSHGNSRKNFRNQEHVLETVISEQLKESHVLGIMLESNIEEGRQDLPLKENEAAKNKKVLDMLNYGQSITDACIGWDQTTAMLRRLAKALRE